MAKHSLESLLSATLIRGAAELRMATGHKPAFVMADGAQELHGDAELSTEAIVDILQPLLDTATLQSLWSDGRIAIKARVEDHRFRIVAQSKEGALVVQAKPMAIATSFLRRQEVDTKRQQIGAAALLEATAPPITHTERTPGRRAGLTLGSELVGQIQSSADGRTPLEWLLLGMEAHKASDLHLRHGFRPCYRIRGELHELSDLPAYTSEEIRQLLGALLDESAIAQFERDRDLDYAFSTREGARFRLNVFVERGAAAVVARRVATTVPTFPALGLPPMMGRLPELTQGLVLVCGPTGSGKSTTLAALIEVINDTRPCNIVTLEDPIEYAYTSRCALIAQREIGIDVKNWTEGLRRVLRQDPDVILIGELRDPETFEVSLQASETGHLVFGTMHSATVAQTLGRILELFPSEQHHNIRQSLAFNLQAIVCQKLLPRREGDGVIPAVELLLSNPSVQKMIREGRDPVLQEILSGDDEMQTFNQALQQLIQTNVISPRVGYDYSPKPEKLKMLLSGIQLGEDARILG